MNRFARLLAIVVLLASSVPFGTSAAQAPAHTDDIPRDVLTGIEAMRRLPADGIHVVESQGRLLLVTTNGHYVVTGGRLIDLWNQIEVRSVRDVDATTRIPLARMGVEARALGGISTGRTDRKDAVTVFIDPASAESRKVLPPLRGIAQEYRVNIVFVPAQPSRAGVSRALICDPRAAQSFFAEGRTPAPVPDTESCGLQQLERARATVQLLGITVLPFTVAPNGATVAGTPANYAAFIAANRESP